MMNRKSFIAAIILFIASGCASSGVVTKNFTVITNPPDAVIRVISGPGQAQEKKYASPARIEAEIPENPALAARSILEISRDNYKSVNIPLRHISNGDTLKIKLEKIITYALKFKLLSPAGSDELRFTDKSIAITFTVGAQSIQMGLTNLGTEPLKIRWQSAEYTDIYGQPRRLMPSGVAYQNRNNPIPDQSLSPGRTLQENITPIEHVFVSPKTGAYDVKPLLQVDPSNAPALKGKKFNLFIPIEIDRQIISYNFKFEISDVLKN